MKGGKDDLSSILILGELSFTLYLLNPQIQFIHIS